MFIAGFPGIGKTFYCNNHKLYTHDSDSSSYSKLPDGSPNPNFIEDYFRHLENLQYVPGLMVMVSTHQEVLDELKRRDMDYYVVIPNEELRSEYEARYETRGSSNELIRTISTNWHAWLKDIKSKHTYFELKTGQTLTDFMIEIYETSHNGSQAIDPERFK